MNTILLPTFNVHLAFAYGRLPQISKFALRRLHTRKHPHFHVLHYVNSGLVCTKPAWCIYATRMHILQHTKWHSFCTHIFNTAHVKPKRKRSKTSRGVSTLGSLWIRVLFHAPAAQLKKPPAALYGCKTRESVFVKNIRILLESTCLIHTCLCRFHRLLLTSSGTACHHIGASLHSPPKAIVDNNSENICTE